MKRSIPYFRIVNVVAELCMQANWQLGEDVIKALRKAREQEDQGLAREIIDLILENAIIASTEKVPLCQDTGMALVFLQIGQEVEIEGNLSAAVTEGVKEGYSQGYLRKSVVSDPFIRINTGDNTPPIIYTEMVPGDEFKITVFAKGFGSENSGAVAMLPPAAGENGMKEFVLQTIRQGGSNACPPLIVGVGVGGTMDKAAFISKKALLRPLGDSHPQPHIARLEEELFQEINRLGIGPQGLGGKTTALAVHIETYPTHIAGLPVAVSVNCHAHRYATFNL